MFFSSERVRFCYRGFRFVDNRIFSDNGKVIKAVNALSADSRHGVNPVVVEEIQVFNSHTAIRNLQVVQGSGRDDSRLVVVADDQILSLKLHRCNSDKITSCR